MSILDMFMNDPAKDARKYTSQIPAVGHQYYDPFVNQGKEAGNTLQGQYTRMLDPQAFLDEIMGHYKTSKGAQYEQDKLSRGIGATAAAGGFAGTPEHQREYGEMASDINSRDMQQYLQNILGIQGTGLQGEQGFYNKGYEASGSLADLLGGNLASEGTMAFQGAQQSNANRMAFFNALAKALATGTGAALGGPAGAAIGAKTFSS